MSTEKNQQDLNVKDDPNKIDATNLTWKEIIDHKDLSDEDRQLIKTQTYQSRVIFLNRFKNIRAIPLKNLEGCTNYNILKYYVEEVIQRSVQEYIDYLKLEQSQNRDLYEWQKFLINDTGSFKKNDWMVHVNLTGEQFDILNISKVEDTEAFIEKKINGKTVKFFDLQSQGGETQTTLGDLELIFKKYYVRTIANKRGIMSEGLKTYVLPPHSKILNSAKRDARYLSMLNVDPSVFKIIKGNCTIGFKALYTLAAISRKMRKSLKKSNIPPNDDPNHKLIIDVLDKITKGKKLTDEEMTAYENYYDYETLFEYKKEPAFFWLSNDPELEEALEDAEKILPVLAFIDTTKFNPDYANFHDDMEEANFALFWNTSIDYNLENSSGGMLPRGASRKLRRYGIRDIYEFLVAYHGKCTNKYLKDCYFNMYLDGYGKYQISQIFSSPPGVKVLSTVRFLVIIFDSDILPLETFPKNVQATIKLFLLLFYNMDRFAIRSLHRLSKEHTLDGLIKNLLNYVLFRLTRGRKDMIKVYGEILDQILPKAYLTGTQQFIKMSGTNTFDFFQFELKNVEEDDPVTEIQIKQLLKDMMYMFWYSRPNLQPLDRIPNRPKDKDGHVVYNYREIYNACGYSDDLINLSHTQDEWDKLKEKDESLYNQTLSEAKEQFSKNKDEANVDDFLKAYNALNLTRKEMRVGYNIEFKLEKENSIKEATPKFIKSIANSVFKIPNENQIYTDAKTREDQVVFTYNDVTCTASTDINIDASDDWVYDDVSIDNTGTKTVIKKRGTETTEAIKIMGQTKERKNLAKPSGRQAKWANYLQDKINTMLIQPTGPVNTQPPPTREEEKPSTQEIPVNHGDGGDNTIDVTKYTHTGYTINEMIAFGTANNIIGRNNAIVYTYDHYDEFYIFCLMKHNECVKINGVIDVKPMTGGSSSSGNGNHRGEDQSHGSEDKPSDDQKEEKEDEIEKRRKKYRESMKDPNQRRSYMTDERNSKDVTQFLVEDFLTLMFSTQSNYMSVTELLKKDENLMEKLRVKLNVPNSEDAVTDGFSNPKFKTAIREQLEEKNYFRDLTKRISFEKFFNDVESECDNNIGVTDESHHYWIIYRRKSNKGLHTMKKEDFLKSKEFETMKRDPSAIAAVKESMEKERELSEKYTNLLDVVFNLKRIYEN